MEENGRKANKARDDHSPKKKKKVTKNCNRIPSHKYDKKYANKQTDNCKMRSVIN